MLRIGLGAFVLATLLGALWLTRGRALALSLALAFPAAEGWLPGADVVRQEVQIPFAGRTVAADLYRSGRPRGVVLAARITTGQPNAGVAYELDAIAAAVIGGTSLSGAVGGVWATAAAAGAPASTAAVSVRRAAIRRT